MFQPDLGEIREFLLDNLGLQYVKSQEKELYSKLSKAAIDSGFGQTKTFIQWLLTQNHTNIDLSKLAIYLTIGETYFFREKKALDFLEFNYLPKLIRKRKNTNHSIKIWSAGCASGEEAYSIAIILTRVLPDYKNWNISVSATDINPDFLQKAQQGIYSKWSFRKTDDSFKHIYFNSLDKNRLQIKSKYKSLVDFRLLNLVKSEYPNPQNNFNDFDIILCRNVLIYFSKEGIKTITNKFYKSLRKGGVLLVSPVESAHLLNSNFSPDSSNNIAVFHKNEGKQIKDKISWLPLKQDYSFKNKIEKKKNVILNSIPHKRFGTEIPALKEVNKKNNTPVTRKSNYNKAKQLFVEGKIKEAESVALNTIENEPNKREDYLLLLASIFAGSGRYSESEDLCHKALKQNKINTEAYYLLAGLYNEQNRTEHAQKALKNTLFLDPDHAPAHFLLGNIDLQKGNITKAKKSFNNAMTILNKKKKNDILMGTEGLTVGNMTEIIISFLDKI